MDTYLGTQLHWLLAGARGFFQLPFGGVDDLEASALISEQFVADMREVSEKTGQAAMNAVLYDYVTSVVDSTVPADGGSFHFNAGTNTLRIGTQGVISTSGPPLFTHEVRHNWVLHSQLCGEARCDPDVTGAWGYHLSAYLLLWRNVYFEGDPDGTERVRTDVELEIKYQVMQYGVAAFQSEPGVLSAEWEEADLSEY